VIKAAGV